jgi:chain length determinant protein EpsF
VDIKSPDPIANILIQAGAIPQLNLATESEIITSERVARRVVKILKLEDVEALKQDWLDDTDGKGAMDAWLAGLLLKKVSVKQVSLQSNVLPIKFDASDPEFAAAVANAFAQAYFETNIELKVEPAAHYAGWFAQQEKLLRDALEKAQTRVSAFQREKGIVAKDEQMDAAVAELSELTHQLASAQGQTNDAHSKERYGNVADMLPEVAGNPLVNALRSDINRQEAKLQEASVNLGRNHPQFQRMELELATLKEKLEIEKKNVVSGFSASRSQSREKEAGLRAAIEAQKSKLLRMRTERDELAVLLRDVDSAKKAFDAVTNRAQQSNLDSQATRTNVSVLSPAVPPLKPSFPKLVLFTLLAFPAGAVLGIGIAYMLEMRDPRIRSLEDLAGALQVPVLGVIRTPGKPRRWGAAMRAWGRRLNPAMRG